jgi:hypothetical protein
LPLPSALVAAKKNVLQGLHFVVLVGTRKLNTLNVGKDFREGRETLAGLPTNVEFDVRLDLLFVPPETSG